eukprot:SAG11_NODE_27025_length_338_cov_0.548117_1_plen_112_part_11
MVPPSDASTARRGGNLPGLEAEDVLEEDDQVAMNMAGGRGQAFGIGAGAGAYAGGGGLDGGLRESMRSSVSSLARSSIDSAISEYREPISDARANVGLPRKPPIEVNSFDDF